MTYNSILPKEEPYVAYSIFHSFFDAMELRNWLEELQKIYHFSLEPKVCSFASPSHILFIVENVHQLIDAAFRLHRNQRFLQVAVMMQPAHLIPDMTLVNAYVHQFQEKNIWSNFPRYLTPKQFYNPYKAINKFCQLETEEYWHLHLEEVTYASLSKQPLSDIENINLFKLSNALYKLIEACHLIDVRISKPKHFILDVEN